MQNDRKDQASKPASKPGQKSVLSDKAEFEKDEGKDTVSHMSDTGKAGAGKTGAASTPSGAKHGGTDRS
ncbi:hypothetical protein [Azospirillum sp. TSO35-2]|uniref:hypothetical protein n=1 Tax=Azospirillum sp. TSO35-2 TaxID=716796 RepID=UPI000D618351|nr:hypothetical protein [Azospirillum sp. TSO35-2]PWC37855.1 hypothetical protein TSO352_10410 [Azospirillum sp. TSO35-2]